MVPQRAVWKALPGWVMLTRRHAEEARTARAVCTCACYCYCNYYHYYYNLLQFCYFPSHFFFPGFSLFPLCSTIISSSFPPSSLLHLSSVSPPFPLFTYHSLSSYHPPLSSYHPPLFSYYPPLSSYHPPLSSYHPPLSSYHPPLSSYHPPLSSLFNYHQILLLPLCLNDDLVNAWGRRGPWTEDSGSVYAPEEVRKQIIKNRI